MATPFIDLSWKLLNAIQQNSASTPSDVAGLIEAGSQIAELKYSDKVKAQVVEADQLSQDLSVTDKAKVLPRLHKLNKQLETVVYFVDNTFSLADVSFFAALAPTVKTWKDAEFNTFYNITRWYDLIQHHPKLASVVAAEKINITFKKNVPKVDPKEQKAKEAAKAQQAAKGQATKGQQAAKPQAAKGGPKGGVKPVEKPEDIFRCDFRVGKIIHVERHPDADSLYKEVIDFGEEKPRTVVSGLVRYVPIEQMQDRFVICLLNLKPANMRGIKSEAMVLVASHPTDESRKELLDAPEGSQPGDRIIFEGHEGEADGQINLSSKGNIFAKMQVDLKTNDSFVACWRDIPMKTAKGGITSKSVAGIIG